MPQTTVAFALAARAHGRDGRLLTAPETLERMRSAAADHGGSEGGLLAGPGSVAGESTVVVQLTSPRAVLPAARAIAASVRPSRTTFSAATAAVASPGDTVESAILATERAASEAMDGIGDADFRESRFVVSGPEPAELLGTLLGLLLEAYDSMTERQRQIVDLQRVSETQQEVATHLGVSRQAINQSLLAAGWPHLERAERTAERELVVLWSAAERAGEGPLR